MGNEELKTMIEMHIKECDGRDARNATAVKEIKEMFKGIWDAQDEMRDKITNLYIKGATILGGLIVVGKMLDYFIAWKSGK